MKTFILLSVSMNASLERVCSGGNLGLNFLQQPDTLEFNS